MTRARRAEAAGKGARDRREQLQHQAHRGTEGSGPAHAGCQPDRAPSVVAETRAGSIPQRQRDHTHRLQQHSSALHLENRRWAGQRQDGPDEGRRRASGRPVQGHGQKVRRKRSAGPAALGHPSRKGMRCFRRAPTPTACGRTPTSSASTSTTRTWLRSRRWTVTTGLPGPRAIPRRRHEPTWERWSDPHKRPSGRVSLLFSQRGGRNRLTGSVEKHPKIPKGTIKKAQKCGELLVN